MGGTEATCPFCEKGIIQIPEFNDDLLGAEEHRFLSLRSAQRPTAAELTHTFELKGWHLLLLPLAFSFFWPWFRSLEDIESPAGMATFMSFAFGFACLLINAGFIRGRRKRAMERAIGKIEAMAGPTPLRMGAALDGHVHLELEQSFSDCSVGVSLELLAYKNVKVTRRDSENRLRTDVVTYVLSSCRSSGLIASRSMMDSGARDLRFSIVAPIHQAHSHDTNEWEISSRKEILFREKTAAMDAQTLLRTTKLKWLLQVELLGKDGVLLRSESHLEAGSHP